MSGLVAKEAFAHAHIEHGSLALALAVVATAVRALGVHALGRRAAAAFAGRLALPPALPRAVFAAMRPLAARTPSSVLSGKLVNILYGWPFLAHQDLVAGVDDELLERLVGLTRISHPPELLLRVPKQLFGRPGLNGRIS